MQNAIEIGYWGYFLYNLQSITGGAAKISYDMIAEYSCLACCIFLLSLEIFRIE